MSVSQTLALAYHSQRAITVLRLRMMKNRRMGKGKEGGKKRTIKTPLIRNIINEQNAHSTPIIRRRDRPEALLPRRVPDLQLDALAVQLDRPDLEVDPNGRDEGGREGVFAEAEEAAGFADA